MLRRIILASLLTFHFSSVIVGEPHHHDLFAVFDLGNSCCEWAVGFADYRAGEEEFHELAWACDNESADLNRGLFVSGSNRSDDLFMFIKRPICGLKPRTFYQVEAGIQFLSQAPTGCIGIGGDPGRNVYMKFGVSAEEPSTVIEAGRVRMNVDIGHQSNDGTNAIVIGNIATGITDCHSEEYEVKELETPAPMIIETDKAGTLWIFVGTDSGFEGTTSVIYTEVCVRIQRHKPNKGL